jgi:hypothetical protein
MLHNFAAAGEPAHPILETFRRLGAINPATAKPWQVVGLANFLNPFYDTQVRTCNACSAKAVKGREVLYIHAVLCFCCHRQALAGGGDG